MAHCGAKTRSGEPCKRHATAGSTRCKLHGGAAARANKGNQNAKTHGIYSAHLSDEERDAWVGLELGRVDDELRLTRIRLARALKAENDAAGLPELEEYTESPPLVNGIPLTDEDDVPVRTTKYKRRDYAGLIDRLTARVESLERTRADLIKSNPPELPPVRRIEIEVVSGRASPKAPDDEAAG